MTPFSRRVFLLGVLAFAAACVSGRGTRPGTEERAYVEVQNNDFSDMTIYVVDGAQRVRLGQATGSRTTRFAIPTALIGFGRDLVFLADPIGSSRASVSERIYVTPGETIQLTILR